MLVDVETCTALRSLVFYVAIVPQSGPELCALLFPPQSHLKQQQEQRAAGGLSSWLTSKHRFKALS